MYGSEARLFCETLRNDDGVLVVCAKPRQEGHAHVLTDCQLAADRGRAVSEDGAFLDAIADRNDWTLVEGGEAVGA